MSRSRSLAGLLLLVLTVGFAATGLVATSASAVVEPKIWGVVLDGKGRPLLDVVVTAVDQDGEIFASDFSYEGGVADDSPRQGYFQLFPQKNGTYTVTLKKAGFASKKLVGVKIAAGGRVQDLGDIRLLRTSRTSAKLVKATVRVGDKGKVKVTVAPTRDKPTGPVVVKKGQKKVGSATLKATHKGELTVTLDKLPKGSHDLKVVYGGSRVHQGSTSARLTLTVKADRNRRLVPNALAYLV